jgi:hypothetical protein
VRRGIRCCEQGGEGRGEGERGAGGELFNLRFRLADSVEVRIGSHYVLETGNKGRRAVEVIACSVELELARLK